VSEKYQADKAGCLVHWVLMALSTNFTSYLTFKVIIYCEKLYFKEC